MSADADLYAVLGVERGATADDLKAGYRARAKECHPDVAQDDPDAAERFRAVEEAYRVLSNAESRKIYDETGQYDANKIAQIELKAATLIMNFIGQFLQSGVDPDTEHFEETITDNINSQLASFHELVPSVHLRIKRAKRLGEMTKRKDNARGDDVVQRAIARQMAALEQQIDQVEQNIAVAKRALEIMDDYEFERQREVFLTFHNMTSSSTGGFFSGR